MIDAGKKFELILQWAENDDSKVFADVFEIPLKVRLEL